MKAALAFLSLATAALAQSSADYAMPMTVLDLAGGAQSSADYAQQTSAGGVHGTSSDATPSLVRAGFAGQIADPVMLQILPQNVVMVEGSSRQAAAQFTLDDGTTSNAAPAEITWSILSGPVATLSSTGLVTAAFVYADSSARIGGAWGYFTSDQQLTIRNIGDDDFGFYASDGVSDVWQVGWFGENNLAGRADRDADSDGQNNLFEFLSGYSPLDGTSFLTTRLLSWDGTQAQLELSRVQPGTVYELESSSDLLDWSLRDKITPTILSEPFVTTLEATDPSAFFRVRLVKAP